MELHVRIRKNTVLGFKNKMQENLGPKYKVQ